jgi:hypothetical protein
VTLAKGSLVNNPRLTSCDWITWIHAQSRQKNAADMSISGQLFLTASLLGTEESSKVKRTIISNDLFAVQLQAELRALGQIVEVIDPKVMRLDLYLLSSLPEGKLSRSQKN